MKKEGGTHLKSLEANFQLHISELEREWTTNATIELPHLNLKLYLKLLHKLLLHNIQKIKHITLPNGTHLMSHKDFQTYYKTPTKLEKNALNIAEQLFCHNNCDQDCPTPCIRHPPPRTLKTKYITNNQTMTPNTLANSLNTTPPQQIQLANPPPHIINNSLKFPIYTILNHKLIESKDKYKITTKYNTYLYQWSLENNLIYNKWMPQRTLFPLNLPLVIIHNTKILKEYYIRQQHTYYKNIADSHFTLEQTRDTRFIPPPTKIPHPNFNNRM